MRDLSGLYNFDSYSTLKSSLKVTSSCLIAQIGASVEVLPPTILKEIGDGNAYLAKISHKDGHYFISPLLNSLSEKMWLVCKDFKPPGSSKGYRLAEGDVLKLGNTKLRLREIHSENNQSSCWEFFNSSEESDRSAIAEEARTPCRVCLSGNNDTSNPLVSPCKCSGTMEFIHANCLKKYLKSKISAEFSEHCVSLQWQSLACDLCMSSLPYTIDNGQDKIDLLDIPKPSGEYLLFEVLSTESNSKRGLFVVSMMGKSSIGIGRGNNVEFRVKDFAMSRYHACLHYIKGVYFIEDCKSKFGTLVQIKRPLIVDHHPISVQTGRTLLKLKIRNSWFLPLCLLGGNSNVSGFLRLDKQTPVLPVSTGVPLSVANTKDLLSRIGIGYRRKKDHKRNTNLMHNPNEVGLNSSIEELMPCKDESDALLAENGLLRLPRLTTDSLP